ncbi:NUDIX hydrolase [Streptomyces phaeochromogenes]|uniref:NUDIX hydrolase n=1 Tax=Streptomyces phaeochromogenes TaxID=1923 RepID=UPI00371ACD24
MGTTGSVPEKVAWVLVREGRVLVTRDEDRDLFYFPGGMREPGESDNETLVREIEEELQAVIVAGTLVHFGTFETRSDHDGRVEFRMICYAAVHRGVLNPAGEIAEMAWFGYGERDRVSPVDQLVFDALHMDGKLP